MIRTLTCLLFFFVFLQLPAQMVTPDGPRYGNEWIDPGQTYLRVMVARDGMYRIPSSVLAAAGLQQNEGEEAYFQLHHNGENIPLAVDAEGVVFYGERARGELDAHLFPNADEQQLNPRYGMYTDTASYYLSVARTTDTPLRYDNRGTDGTAGSPLSRIYRTAERVFGEDQSKYYFRSGGSSIIFSHYELAEGFGSRSGNDLLSSNGTTETTTELELPGAVDGTAELTMRFGLAFRLEHEQEISVNNTLLGVTRADNWSVHNPVYSFSLDDDRATVTVAGQGGDKDKANLAFIELTYPAEPAMEGEQLPFSLPAGTGGRLDFANLTAEARLYDLTNGLVYEPDAGGFNLPGEASERNFILTVTELEPAATEAVVLQDWLPPAGTDYLMLSSRRLAGSELQQMADYRASAQGGSYKVHVVYAEDLYNGYGYGQNYHPRAIKNYLEAAMAAAPTLSHLFIVGKGREYTARRTAAELAGAWSTFFVPSFGLPASDNLLTAPIDGVIPALATGRLAVVSPQEIGLYVGKLREVERQVDLANQTIGGVNWMKQALFLGGGQTPGEQAQIRQNLAQMEDRWEDSYLGGDVTSFFRTSTEPIENSRKDAIFERINAGTSLITFHGHSSSQGFDFSIDNPENYENQAKYPLMLSLGCYSGDAFGASRSISERFIFLPDGGAITFAASKGLGFPSALGIYGNQLIELLADEAYGEGVGRAFQLTSEALSDSRNFSVQLLLEQFALSGDPAFRMHPRPGPDLVIDAQSVRIEPATVPAQDTAYTSSLRIVNLGVYGEDTPDSVRIRFRQRLPDGQIVALAERMVRTPRYETQLTISLPNPGLSAVGLNRLLITVDSDDRIAELPVPAAESNNDVMIGGQPGIPFTVVANTARVAFPPPYAVVGGSPQLIASTSDPLAPERDYLLQVATAANFEQPIVDERITTTGGIIRHSPAIAWTDSTTYYWRISPDSSKVASSELIWSESSFTYVTGQEEVGFAIQHPGQFANGTSEQLLITDISEQWNFARNINDVELFNGVYEDRSIPRLVWNGTRFASPHPWRIRAGIQVMVIDSINNGFGSWTRYPGDNSYNSVGGASTTWNFDTRTPEGREGLMRFLDEGVEEGKYVIVWSVQRGSDIEYHSDAWSADSSRVGRTIYGVLEGEGAEQARLLTQFGSVPYSFAYQKGSGPIAEALATSQDAQTSIQIPLQENWQEGRYVTDRIGPALAYEDMEARVLPRHVGPSDSIYFRLYGFSDQTGSDVLREGFLELGGNLRFTYDISDIDAGRYPYLQVEFELYDEEERTSTSIEEIYLNYQRPPDVAVSPAVAYSIPDSLTEGQRGRIEVGYANISGTDMDSLLVLLEVIDTRNEVSTLTKRQPPLPAQTTGTVSFDLPDDASNDLRLQLTLNPDEDQPEVVLFNNFLFDDIGVTVDGIDPDLQVYYDGRRIREGELISSQPEILIQLRDENPYRRLDDSSAYEIILRAPDGTEERIRMSDSRVDYLPAPAEGDNLAEIYFRPELLVDGEYTLIVRAADRSSNTAGRLNYEQTFEVINEQLVANVLTYPNPFSTQTSFVYTLTGSTPPTMFRVQIMTVSGRVVRDIDLMARENITIGTHQTEFKWDGTDEYGDKLANGVYLYRVITSNGEGEALESYDTGTDQYFQNGLGKVVILR